MVNGEAAQDCIVDSRRNVQGGAAALGAEAA
jgi:hypothetical protein